MSEFEMKAREKLKEYGQEHVLAAWDSLKEAEKENLVQQILATDFSVLKMLDEKQSDAGRGKITPIEAMQIPEIEAGKEHFIQTGLEAIRAGKVGAVLLAGGMGTRLGSDNPKGMYNIGITKEVYIFERLIENLMDVVRQADAWVDLFIMTSEKNDEATRTFLKDKNYFGYDREHVFFFMQETAPAVDYKGHIYMENKARMATSPNGNGGWFVSLERSEAGKRLEEKQLEWLNVFAVDNVLQRIADPCFVGATIERECLVGAKVICKNAPDEKVGVMCLEDGKPSIVEYYELTEELMNTKDAKGEPAYNYGVILNYLFNIQELRRIAGVSLPLHKVEKKIPYMDEAGNEIRSEEPNGYKFEALVLDMIHQMDRCLPFEVVREKEFAPIKNKTGKDSVESARELCRMNGIEL